MVPDRQKVRTDGRNGRMDGRSQNYIPPTSSGDKKITEVCESYGGQPFSGCMRSYSPN